METHLDDCGMEGFSIVEVREKSGSFKKRGKSEIGD